MGLTAGPRATISVMRPRFSAAEELRTGSLQGRRRRADVDPLGAGAPEEVTPGPRGGRRRARLHAVPPVRVHRRVRSSRWVDAEPRRPVEQRAQPVDRRPRVGQRPAVGAAAGRATGRPARAASAPALRPGASGGRATASSILPPARRAGPLSGRGLEEPEVEPRVARDQDGARQNPRKLGSTSAIGGAPPRIVVVIPVSTLDVGGMGWPGIDQRLELAEHLPAAHLDGSDLGDRAVLGRAPGRLEVDHDERDVRQRRAEFLQGGLVRSGVGRRGRVRPHGAQTAAMDDMSADATHGHRHDPALARCVADPGEALPTGRAGR